jgi:hypothetical protein
MTVLRNLGYELTGIRKNPAAPAITAIHRGSIWTAVGVRHGTGDRITWPLYPVVNTSAGPRILLEVDLIASPQRARGFLNRAALDRLHQLPPATTAELKQLFQQYQSGIAEAAPP